MKVYVPFKRDRVMVAFVKSKGVDYLPKGKRLPGIAKKKRIVVPLYTMEDITNRFPGLAQEIDEYSIIAGAASEAERVYEEYRAYLIRKAFGVIGVTTGRDKEWELNLAYALINKEIQRVRVFTDGYEENVFVISVVSEQNRSESVRQGGDRVMFIRVAPSEAKTTDFEELAQGWMIHVPGELKKGEVFAVRCPLAFVQKYREVYMEHKRLKDERERRGSAIAQAYADLKSMAVETERGFFVMYNVSPTIVSAHQRRPSIRVLFVDPEKKKQKQEQKEREQEEQKQEEQE